MNKTIARILIVSFCILRFCFMPIIYAQSLTQPGDAGLKYSMIHPGYSSYKLTVYDSLGKVTREIVQMEMISIDTAKGLLTKAQHSYFPGGFIMMDSSVADMKTLSPKRMRMVCTPSVMKMDLAFEDRSVHAVVERNNVFKDTTHMMDTGYFDSNLFTYLLGLLPYQDGYKTQINVYTFEQDGMDPHKIEYLGEDILAGTTAFCHLVKITVGHNKANEYGWYNSITGELMRYILPIKKGLLVINKI